jgi:hypothetical protein
MIRRHAGTGHDQILLREYGTLIGAEGQRAAEVAQLLHCSGKLLGAAIIGRGDASATRDAKARRGHAGSRDSHDQNAFALEFGYGTHSYLSFNVVSENSAKTSATIQKRTMIFDSLQPANSK